MTKVKYKDGVIKLLTTFQRDELETVIGRVEDGGFLLDEKYKNVLRPEHLRQIADIVEAVKRIEDGEFAPKRPPVPIHRGPG